MSEKLKQNHRLNSEMRTSKQQPMTNSKKKKTRKRKRKITNGIFTMCTRFAKKLRCRFLFVNVFFFKMVFMHTNMCAKCECDAKDVKKKIKFFDFNYTQYGSSQFSFNCFI